MAEATLTVHEVDELGSVTATYVSSSVGSKHRVDVLVKSQPTEQVITLSMDVYHCYHSKQRRKPACGKTSSMFSCLRDIQTASAMITSSMCMKEFKIKAGKKLNTCTPDTRSTYVRLISVSAKQRVIKCRTLYKHLQALLLRYCPIVLFSKVPPPKVAVTQTCEIQTTYNPQGVGVGDSTATPTTALLLSVLQESMGRIATILFAHRLGTSIEPECKMYRLAADVFNDAAMVLNCLSPALPKASRVFIFSMSSVLRALCGVAAGSSKASLSAHFSKWDNLGELNAVSGSCS